MLLWYQGFPPLADWVQGLLWRLTGSVTLAGAANLIGLIVFLFVVKQIGGHPGIAGIVCLTTPLIVIHTTLCYIDLLSNSFLAVSLVSLGHAMLYRNYSSQPLLLTIVGAAVLAAWSKMLMVPLTIASLLLLLALVLVDEPRKAIRRRITSAVVCGLIAAAAPYLHNLARYGNPIWPLRAPLIGRHLPFAMAPVNYDRPAHLVGTSQPELFVRSLLETENPSEYPNRSRWTADQGATSAAHRMGGYWWVSVVTALIVLPTVAIAAHGRRGVRLIAALAAVLGVCALLPQAHELRYYQFIPLTWAGVIGCALPRFGHARPGCALMIVCLLVLEFCASTWMNKEYYDTQPVTLEAIAKARGLKDWWGRLSPGRKYYAVGMEPAAILLAGPTLREFRIEESSDPILCPPDAEIVYRGRVGKASTFVSVQEATKSGEKLLARGYVRLAERICRAVLHKDDSHYDATTLLARVLDTAEKRIEAKSVWRAALRMAQQRGDSSMERICRDKLASDQ